MTLWPQKNSNSRNHFFLTIRRFQHFQFFICMMCQSTCQSTRPPQVEMVISRWYYHRAVKFARGWVGHLSKNALMLLDFSKNWHREVKFCPGFKNLGLDIWNRTHDQQFENWEIFTLWLIVVNVVKLKCRDQNYWIRDKILLPGANL